MTKQKDWHDKIAKARGERWLKNVRQGRINAVLNPSALSVVRRKNNLLQSDVAEKLNLSESTYQAIERGKRLVTQDVAKQIAQTLGAPMSRLFRSEKDKHVAILIKTEL